jgi:hypothetical protein
MDAHIYEAGKAAPLTGAYIEIADAGTPTGVGLWCKAGELLPKVPHNSKWKFVDLPKREERRRILEASRFTI